MGLGAGALLFFFPRIYRAKVWSVPPCFPPPCISEFLSLFHFKFSCPFSSHSIGTSFSQTRFCKTTLSYFFFSPTKKKSLQKTEFQFVKQVEIKRKCFSCTKARKQKKKNNTKMNKTYHFAHSHTATHSQLNIQHSTFLPLHSTNKVYYGLSRLV